MSAKPQHVDAELGTLALSRATEDELLELFHAAETPAQRCRIVAELAERRRGDSQ